VTPKPESGSLLEARRAELQSRVREASAALVMGEDATVEYLRGAPDPFVSATAILSDEGEATKGDATVVARSFVLLVAALQDIRNLPHGERDEPACSICRAVTRTLRALGVEE
jgi:hypothetical protein